LDKRVIHIHKGETETKNDKIKANFLSTIFAKTKYVINIPRIDTERASQKRIYGENPKIFTNGINIQ